METATVHVLDDDEQILSLVAAALEAEGYDVITSNSRKAFDAALQQREADVFLLDVRLPDGNGMRIGRELRARTQSGIIFLTSENDSVDRILGLELGADDYVSKPFNIRELRARVNAVYRRVAGMRRPRPGDDPSDTAVNGKKVRVFHGLSLDHAARRVTDRHGDEIALTTLEFELLAALSDTANRVLTRDQLMDRVRGPGWMAYDRNIDGLISRLRRKLFPNGDGEKMIKTIRGVGYMLVPDP